MLDEKLYDAQLRCYTVGGKEFVLPDEITVRQYQTAKKEFGSVLDTGTDMKLSDRVLQFIAGGYAPKLFAILLVPKGEPVWKPEHLNNEEIFNDIGDRTAIEVVQYFLSGRVDLMQTFVSFLTNSIEKSKILGTSLIDSRK